LKIHCHRLEEMEYLMVHSGGRGKPISYELLYDGQVSPEGRHLTGLIDPLTLVQGDEKLGQVDQKSGQTIKKAVPSQPQVTPKSGVGQTGQSQSTQGLEGELVELAEKTHIRGGKKHSSPRPATVAAQA
jgi:hypothetical protein